jgi:ribosomal protein L11 methyltransferase
MPWLNVTVEVEEAGVEALAEAFLAAGALSVDVSDPGAGSAAEQAIFDEPGAGGPRGWQRSRVAALLPESLDAGTVVARACAHAGIAPPPYRVTRIADQDWVRVTQAQFAPIRISQRLWIVPSWHEAPDPAALNILLDPGLAFGTGSHPTTRLCLRWLERVVRGGETVIDFGCGSGILAIAASRLGAARVSGFDVDEAALLAARRNAMHNRVDASFHDAKGPYREPAHIVVANILAHPLIVLAPLLASLTLPGGRLALAGLLTAQADAVCAAYREWFETDVEDGDDGWVLVSGRRR